MTGLSGLATGQDSQITGRFGKALNAQLGAAMAAGQEEYRRPPLTVECWVKLFDKQGFNIIAASETKTSASHWEIYTYAGSGVLSAYVPGLVGEIKSDADICDRQWHHLAMVYLPDSIKLYVDGQLVKEQQLPSKILQTTKAGLAIGGLVEGSIGCNGFIDELRISTGALEVGRIPDKPLQKGDTTVGLWDFDVLDNEMRFPDRGKLKNYAIWIATTDVSHREQEIADTPKKKITGHWGEDALGFRWTEGDSVDERWQQTDVGPFLASTFAVPGGFAEKGLAIRIGNEQQAAVCYDTGKMSLAAGWTGDFLKFDPARYGLIRHIQFAGKVQFDNANQNGWLEAKAKYTGMYQHGWRVVLESIVDGAKVFESPWLESNEETQAFARNLQIGPADKLTLNIAHYVGEVESTQLETGQLLAVRNNNRMLAVALIAEDKEDAQRLKLETTNSQLVLRIAKHAAEVRCKVLIYAGMVGSIDDFKTLAEKSRVESDLKELIEPGAAIWNERIETSGKLGSESGPYVLDTIGIPFDNPYRALMFLTGHDFLPDGRLAVCTVHGDVWLVDGIDESLKKTVWKRFATGLYQPLGLKIVDGEIFVLGRDQITQLHDRDKNDEADFYGNFNNDGQTSTGTHDYATCLETDGSGNFYYVRANQGLVRVSADGKDHQVLATGFRNPHGLGVSPDGIITVAPQEGEWTPTSAICEVIPGNHFGYGGPKFTEARPLGYDPPMCWIPRMIDNSSGAQTWVDSERWGPLQSQMLHFSFGKCRMLLALREQVDGISQGGVVAFPFEFESGASRGRFSPHDGQLYVSGLMGWVSSAAKDGCLQRVRYVGGEVLYPTGLHAVDNGVVLRFAAKLDRKSAEDPDNFSIQQWNYRYSQEYGSPEFRVSQPTQLGRDDVEIKSATLLPDGRSVFLEIEHLQPVMQMATDYDLVAASGTAFSNTIYLTINAVSNQRLEPGPHADQPRAGQLSAEMIAGLQTGLEGRFESLPDGAHASGDDSPQTHWAKLRCAALHVPAGFPPVDGMAPQPFRLHGTGWLRLRRKEKASFRVLGTSQAELVINGQALLPIPPPDSQSLIGVEFTAVRLRNGFNRIEFSVDSDARGALAIQIQWSSSNFIWESLPPQQLYFTSENLAETQQVEMGADLFLNRGCLRCHDLPQVVNAANARTFPSLAGPNLSGIGSTLSADWLREWILRPHELRNDSRMPRLLHLASAKDQQLAADIAAYLQTLVADQEQIADDADRSKEGEALFEQLGCVGCHHFNKPDKQDEFDRVSLRFVAAKFKPAGLRLFLQNPQRTFPQSRMPKFDLSQEKLDALFDYVRNSSKQNLDSRSTDDKGNAKVGEQAFSNIGCAQCHLTSRTGTLPAAPLKLTKAVRAAKDCLAEAAKAAQVESTEMRLAAYDLSTEQRDAIRRFVNLDAPSRPQLQFASRWQSAERAYRQQRCFVCHSRDGVPALLPEVVDVEGVLGFAAEWLPDLSLAGEKLKPDWTLRLLSGEFDYRARPWLKALMPSFHDSANEIAAGFADQHGIVRLPFRADAQGSTELAEPLDAELVNAGRALISQQQGHDCRQCHALGSQPAVGDARTQIALGINFAYVSERLQREYYDRWMADPLRIDPQTKMPKYSVDGKTTKVEKIFDGDTQLQYEAIWQYLQSIK